MKILIMLFVFFVQNYASTIADRNEIFNKINKENIEKATNLFELQQEIKYLQLFELNSNLTVSILTPSPSKRKKMVYRTLFFGWGALCIYLGATFQDGANQIIIPVLGAGIIVYSIIGNFEWVE